MATAVLGTGCFWCTEACYSQLKGVSRVVSGYAGGHVASPTYEQVCGKKTGHIEVVRVTFDPAVVSYRDLLDVFFTIHDPTTPDRQGAPPLLLRVVVVVVVDWWWPAVPSPPVFCLLVNAAPTNTRHRRQRLNTTQHKHNKPNPKQQTKGNDVGPQYASAIFYADDAQEAAAKDAMAAASSLWPAPIVTKLLPLATDGPAKFWPAEEYHWDYYARNPGQGADCRTGLDWNGLWSGSVNCLAQWGRAMVH